MIGAIIVKSKVRSTFACLNRRDLPAFLSGWADDATFFYPGNISVSGKMQGKKTIQEWFRKYLDQFPKLNFTLKSVSVQNIFAFGGTNVVTVDWDLNLTNREGKDFPNSGVTIISVKKGRVILVRDYIFDTEMLKRAWGEEKV
jgi:ketosteroid isomerase-like protein